MDDIDDMDDTEETSDVCVSTFDSLLQSCMALLHIIKKWCFCKVKILLVGENIIYIQQIMIDVDILYMSLLIRLFIVLLLNFVLITEYYMHDLS